MWAFAPQGVTRNKQRTYNVMFPKQSQACSALQIPATILQPGKKHCLVQSLLSATDARPLPKGTNHLQGHNKYTKLHRVVNFSWSNEQNGKRESERGEKRERERRKSREKQENVQIKLSIQCKVACQSPVMSINVVKFSISWSLKELFITRSRRTD